MGSAPHTNHNPLVTKPQTPRTNYNPAIFPYFPKASSHRNITLASLVPFHLAIYLSHSHPNALPKSPIKSTVLINSNIPNPNAHKTMSNPSSANTSPLALHHHHHHPHQRAIAAPPPPPPLPPPTSPSSSIREYRKGNWTLQETLILITAKRLDDERRYPGGSGGASGGGSGGSGGGRPAEQRWKWIENYCWKNGCHRSQNQCNDKWDNLLREYKKVRDYESRSVAAISAAGEDEKAAGSSTENPSYWTMERLERKERNLPTNLAREVFDALTDVLGRRAARRGLPLALLPPPPETPGTVAAAATVSMSPSVSVSPSPSPQPTQKAPSPLLPLPVTTMAQPPPPIASVSQSQPSFSGMSIVLFQPFINLLFTLLSFFMKMM